MERAGITDAVSGLRAAVIAASAAGLLLFSAAVGLSQDRETFRESGLMPPPGLEYPQPPAGASPPIEYDPSRLEFRARTAPYFPEDEVPAPAKEEETVLKADPDAKKTAQTPWPPFSDLPHKRPGEGF
jgi:hypothetical protein